MVFEIFLLLNVKFTQYNHIKFSNIREYLPKNTKIPHKIEH